MNVECAQKDWFRGGVPSGRSEKLHPFRDGNLELLHLGLHKGSN